MASTTDIPFAHRRAALFATLAVVVTACSFPDYGGFGGAPQPPDAGEAGVPAMTTSTTTTSTTTTSTSSGGVGGSTSSSSASSGGVGGSTSVTLPLTVSTVFVPSGYMGDGVTANSVVMLPVKPSDPHDCGGNRSPTALGTCYMVTYTPVPSGQGWAGVYWQYPAGNWGAMPGLDVSAGATEVSVWAKGGAGGEQLTIVAGGIQTANMAHKDTFKVDTVATLTTSWAKYKITLPSTYGPVLGGFAWSVSAPNGGGSVHLFIDSIRWK